MANAIKVPYRLSWNPSKLNAHGTPSTKPGRGEAGWTVAAFATLDDAHAFARRHPEAAMPCWRRAECWGGRELGT